MQKIKKGPTDVAETLRMSQLGSLELKFKSGQMANFWTDTELQARGEHLCTDAATPCLKLGIGPKIRHLPALELKLQGP